MRTIGGVEKYTESEAREIAEQYGLDIEECGEVLRKCSTCGAWVAVEDYHTDDNCQCMACVNKVPDNYEYEDYEEDEE
jgi:DNA-directed RNA polymerase subunit RPC12/RpoP